MVNVSLEMCCNVEEFDFICWCRHYVLFIGWIPCTFIITSITSISIKKSMSYVPLSSFVSVVISSSISSSITDTYRHDANASYKWLAVGTLESCMDEVIWFNWPIMSHLAPSHVPEYVAITNRTGCTNLSELLPKRQVFLNIILLEHIFSHASFVS